MRLCKTCHVPISSVRLVALPMTTVCAACSTEEPLRGVMVFSHKTAPVIQVVPRKEFDTYKRYDRKGVRSGLPMSPRTISGTTGSVSRTIDAQNASNTPPNLRTEDTTPRARCQHKDQPQASAAGHCVECALAYYQVRMQWKSVPAKTR